MKVKEIKLCFENCEAVRLNSNMFKYLIIDGIKKDKHINCYQYGDGEIQEINTCEYFSIQINEAGLKQKGWLEDERTLKERLQSCSDIVSIVLIYEDNTEEEIYVEWSDYSKSENKYQREVHYEDGTIGILICKDTSKLVE